MMKEIVLLTKDTSLRRELSDMLPKGFNISSRISIDKNTFVFFDMDTIKLELIKELCDKAFVIAITRQKITGPVMEATTFGAYEIVHHPLNKDIVIKTLQELEYLSNELKNIISVTSLPPTPTCAIVGHSPIIMDVCKKISRLARVDVPVLITGETGTGKELIAESILQLSSRFGKPFVVINCSTVPETLFESELFGFEKGSFTGAGSTKEGILKIADEGCVFLDEVGELPLLLQSKLLRFLQTQTFYPLGSTKEAHVNVRIISATNRNLLDMIKERKFREDLYHRLRVTTIHIPPLREHKEDILPLLHFFINRYRHTAPRYLKGFTMAFLKKMISHDWTGNIREIENTIRSAIAISNTNYLTTYELKELGTHPPLVTEKNTLSENLASILIPFIKEALKRKDKNIYDKIHSEVDKFVFDYILSYTKENQSESARILGINRLTLKKKLKY